MPTPSQVNFNDTFTPGEKSTYHPNTNTDPIKLTAHRKGTQIVLIPDENADIQIKKLPELSRYAWDLDPTHKNPDGTPSKYKGSMNMKKLKFCDDTSLQDRVNLSSSV